MYDHPFDDEWQRRRSPFCELDQVDIPVLSIGAWGKGSLHLRGNFEGSRLVNGPKQLRIVGAKSFAETQLLDVMVKLSLLSVGDGKPPAIKVTQGWLRASRRAEHPDLTTGMRPFLRHDREEPITPGQTYELRIELLPMSALVRAGDRLRLEISNWESAQTEAPMTRWYGQKVGTDTYHHDATRPSRLRLHERPRKAAQNPQPDHSS